MPVMFVTWPIIFYNQEPAVRWYVCGWTAGNRWKYSTETVFMLKGFLWQRVPSLLDEPATMCPACYTHGKHAIRRHKAQPHAVMLHTCDGAFQSSCDAGISHAMFCDVNSNMFNILLPIMEYLSQLLSEFQTVCSIMMEIQ